MPGPANFLKKQDFFSNQTTSNRSDETVICRNISAIVDCWNLDVPSGSPNLGEFALDEDPALAQLLVLTAPKVLCHNSAPQFLSMYQEFLNLRQK